MRGRHDQTPLITDAQASLDDEFDARRRKYAVMMTLRAVCVIAAGVTYTISILLAIALMVGGVLLPWCAVLIANDRAPKKHWFRRPYQAPPAEHTLPAGPDQRVIEI